MKAYTNTEPRFRPRWAIACAVVAVLMASCGPGPLKAEGEILVMPGKEDSALRTISNSIPDLDILQAFSNESVDLIVNRGFGGRDANRIPDLIFAEVNPGLIGAADRDRFLDLSPYLPRMASYNGLNSRYGAILEDYPWFLPGAEYWWGLYFDPGTLDSLGDVPPETWEQLMTVAEKAQKEGLVPFALGTAFGWPASLWFAYADLRLNGPEAYRSLLRGDRSFEAPDFVEAAKYVESMRDNGFFGQDAGTTTWSDSLNAVTDGKAVFSLMGALWIDRHGHDESLDFIPVPIMYEDLPRGELSALTGFVIPAAAPLPETAMAVADLYIAAGSPGMVSDKFRLPISGTVEGASAAKTRGAALLRKADTVLLPFDRAFPSAFVSKAMTYFADFFADPGMRAEDLCAALETARREGSETPDPTPDSSVGGQ